MNSVDFCLLDAFASFWNMILPPRHDGVPISSQRNWMGLMKSTTITGGFNVHGHEYSQYTIG
jgi:hypothetical protein